MSHYQGKSEHSYLKGKNVVYPKFCWCCFRISAAWQRQAWIEQELQSRNYGTDKSKDGRTTRKSSAGENMNVFSLTSVYLVPDVIYNQVDIEIEFNECLVFSPRWILHSFLCVWIILLSVPCFKNSKKVMELLLRPGWRQDKESKLQLDFICLFILILKSKLQRNPA